MTSQTQRLSNKEKKSSSVWRVLTLGDVISISSGSGLSKSSRDDNGEYLVYGGNGVTGKHSEYLFETKKLIIGRVGANCGNAYITKPKSWVTDNAFVVTFNEDETDIHFLKEMLNYLKLNKYSSSTAQPVISQAKIYPISISLPPYSEQLAIISKIEELFSELDKGIESLRLAQKQLKVYRQSVLKWAFEGRLTNENVKEGEFPEGWQLIKLSEVSELITKGASPKWQGINYVDDHSQVLFVTSENVRENYIDISSPKYLELEFNKKQKRSILKKGDVLLNIVGASIGRAAIFDFELNANINQAVSVIRTSDKVVNKYLSYYLNSNSAFRYYDLNKVDVARANLSLQDVGNIEFGLPSKVEQYRVIDEVDSRLSMVDKMEESINQSLLHSETLRQSILKMVFEGKITQLN